jgi:uncharacterized membrane protein
MTRAMRVRPWMLLAAALVVASLVGWTVSNGHPWLGIATIVLFFVVPNLVTMALSIKRSRQRAETARRARTSKSL